MAITSYKDPKFLAYVKHVLSWEGKLSKDPGDHAITCLTTYPGATGPYHTNKGLTWCNFVTDAKRLGITPVSYDHFIKLTDEEIGAFLFDIFKNKPWSILKSDALKILITEIAWGSGDGNVWPHLIDAFNALGIKTIPKRKKYAYSKADRELLLNTAKKIDQKLLYDTLIKVRYNFLNILGKGAYGRKYIKGWLNRMNGFVKLSPAWTANSFFFRLFTYLLPS